ncbi:unnamed protein product [Angiostrongylus costaricensis]|uniref:Uncharacterized protein n=1 Tax=Angiostrongylus costaricensis TaxID=334426 RepID=A0A0R3PDA0_ANGCS|nr:unnamed protein product [Angiostrongylus costaricensis]
MHSALNLANITRLRFLSLTAPNNLTEKLLSITLRISSKIGLFIDHKLQAAEMMRTNVKSESKEKATPKIDSKSDHVPPIPEKKMITNQPLDQKLELYATSKVDFRDNIDDKLESGNA